MNFYDLFGGASSRRQPDRLFTLLQAFVQPTVQDLNAMQSWRVRGGLQDCRGRPEEHWDKTLMLLQ